jgi:hypothetical protein
MHENYELRVPVFRIEQRKPCVSGLEHVPNHDNFDVELSPLGKITRLAKFTGGQIVRGSEHVIYDEFDKLVRSIEFDDQGVETANTLFEYGADGIFLGSTSRDVSGTVIWRSVEEFVGNLPVSRTTFRADGAISVQKTFEYAEEKLAKSASAYYGPDGGLAERCLSTYDSAGRLAETFGLKPNGEPLGDGRYRYKYDDEGRKLEVLSFNDTGNDTAPSHVTRFVYTCDKHGNWIERCEYGRFRNDSGWRVAVTTRKLTYYAPAQD